MQVFAARAPLAALYFELRLTLSPISLRVDLVSPRGSASLLVVSSCVHSRFMSRIYLTPFVSVAFFVSCAQTQYFFVDSLSNGSSLGKTNITLKEITYKDTSVIELHTWYYYNPGMIISDSTFHANGQQRRKQTLITKEPTEKLEFEYRGDTVLAEFDLAGNSWMYSALKIRDPNFEVAPWPNMDQFGWDVRMRDGQVVDSVLFEDNRPQLYRSYYANGQLAHYEFIENGKVHVIDYRENGRRIKSKRYQSNRYVHIPDTVNVLQHASGRAKTLRYVQEDTTLVKMFTWQHYLPGHWISDSTYRMNSALVHEQKLYWPISKAVDSKFIYCGDTIFQEYYGKDFTNYTQSIRIDDVSKTYGYNDFREFGWSISIHKNGYIMDSTLYDNGEVLQSKTFYSSGQLKSHRYREEGELSEVKYRRNGKIKYDMDWLAWYTLIGVPAAIAVAALR